MRGMFDALFHATQTRPRPEDVAQLVLEALGEWPIDARDRAILDRAARFSFKRMARSYSSMASDFQRPVAADKQVRTAAVVFGVDMPSSSACCDPDQVLVFVETLSASIHRERDSHTRMNRAQRHAVGVFKCQRWYNKRFRILVHLEDKIRRLALAVRKYDFTRISKSALATKIRREDFDADLNTACFVAYMSARMSTRSMFTNASQERAYDEIADMLLERCKRSPTTRWDVIAHVVPDEVVLRRLSDEQRGMLLGRWWSILVDMAEMLRGIATTTNFNRAKMIVSRGNDSSTWNQVAGGWNKAREHWISLLYALGAEGLLVSACPGKVMRLMAADVARWHESSGGGAHPDTKVWADLPPPWEVVRGEASCGLADIETACRRHGVTPTTWTSARGPRKPVPFKPTPELVHGVSVASPDLAMVLRKAGVFSGKDLRHEPPNVMVERDALGFALRATEV